MKNKVLYVIDSVLNILSVLSIFFPVLEVQAIVMLVQAIMCVIMFCVCLILRGRILDRQGENDIFNLIKANNLNTKHLIFKSAFLMVNGTMFIVLGIDWEKFFCIASYIVGLLSVWVVVAQYRILHIYPLNTVNDYLLNPIYYLEGNRSNNITIKFIEIDFGVWTSEYNGKSLLFDLRGCLFPKSVIISYLGRQLRYKQINELKLPLKSLWKRNLEIGYLLKYQCTDIVVYFEDKKGRVFQKNIVENTVSKLNYTESKLIIDTVYSRYSLYTRRVLPKIQKDKYKFLNERIFLNYSDVNFQKSSLQLKEN